MKKKKFNFFFEKFELAIYERKKKKKKKKNEKKFQLFFKIWITYEPTSQ